MIDVSLLKANNDYFESDYNETFWSYGTYNTEG